MLSQFTEGVVAEAVCDFARFKILSALPFSEACQEISTPVWWANPSTALLALHINWPKSGQGGSFIRGRKLTEMRKILPPFAASLVLQFYLLAGILLPIETPIKILSKDKTVSSEISSVRPCSSFGDIDESLGRTLRVYLIWRIALRWKGGQSPHKTTNCTKP